jgi:hypothetical protein
MKKKKKLKKIGKIPQNVLLMDFFEKFNAENLANVGA